MAVRTFMMAVIVGFALIALTSCGISRIPYRHGYDGQNNSYNTEYYRNGNGYVGEPPAAPEYYPGGRGGYGPMMGYGPGRNGYCTR